MKHFEIAKYLLWIQLAFGVANSIATFIYWSNVKIEDPSLKFVLDNLPITVAITVVMYIVMFVLCLMIVRGKNWARILYLIGTLIGVVSIFGKSKDMTPWGPATMWLGLLVSLYISWVLFFTEARENFRRPDSRGK